MTEAPDPRHMPLMQAIDNLYRYHNQLPMPNGPRVAKALSLFLKANRLWEFETIEACIVNRFKSDGINPAEEPWVWLPYLARYVRGPLDKYNKPKVHGGTHNDPGCPEYWEAKLKEKQKEWLEERHGNTEPI